MPIEYGPGSKEYNAAHGIPAGGYGHGGGSGSGAGNPPMPPSAGPAPEPPKPTNLVLDAESDPYLEELVGRKRKQLDELGSGTGHTMDVLGSRLRDSREGGRKQLSNSAAFRGVDDTSALSRYDSETNRGVTSALSDEATRRQEMMEGALSSALGIYGAPGVASRAEKGIGLAAFNANNAAQGGWWDRTRMVGQDNFSNWMSILDAQNKVLQQTPNPVAPAGGGSSNPSPQGFPLGRIGGYHF